MSFWGNLSNIADKAKSIVSEFDSQIQSTHTTPNTTIDGISPIINSNEQETSVKNTVDNKGYDNPRSTINENRATPNPWADNSSISNSNKDENLDLSNLLNDNDENDWFSKPKEKIINSSTPIKNTNSVKSDSILDSNNQIKLESKSIKDELNTLSDSITSNKSIKLNKIINSDERIEKPGENAESLENLESKFSNKSFDENSNKSINNVNVKKTSNLKIQNSVNNLEHQKKLNNREKIKIKKAKDKKPGLAIIPPDSIIRESKEVDTLQSPKDVDNIFSNLSPVEMPKNIFIKPDLNKLDVGDRNKISPKDTIPENYEDLLKEANSKTFPSNFSSISIPEFVKDNDSPVSDLIPENFEEQLMFHASKSTKIISETKFIPIPDGESVSSPSSSQVIPNDFEEQLNETSIKKKKFNRMDIKINLNSTGLNPNGDHNEQKNIDSIPKDIDQKFKEALQEKKSLEIDGSFIKNKISIPDNNIYNEDSLSVKVAPNRRNSQVIPDDWENRLAEAQNSSKKKDSESPKVDVSELIAHAVSSSQKQVENLQILLKERERQLENQGSQLASMQDFFNVMSESMQIDSSTNFDKLKDEFSNRILNYEEKISKLFKENERIRKNKKSEDDGARVTALMKEGEKLAEKVLKYESIIKTLRTQEKTFQSTKESMEVKISSLEMLVGKEKERITTLTKDIERYKAFESEYGSFEKLKEDFEKSKEELEKTRSETKNTKDQIVSQGLLSTELEKSKKEKIALEDTISEQRLSFQRSEREYTLKEKQLRDEILDLSNRLRASEERNAQLASSIPEATRPLMRQIEQIQDTIEAKEDSFKEVEKSLMNRLRNSQSALDKATSSERKVLEQYNEVSRKVSSLENEMESLKLEEKNLLNIKKSLESKIIDNKIIEDELKSRISELEETLVRNERAFKGQLDETLKDLKAEGKKNYKLQDEIVLLKRKIAELDNLKLTDTKSKNLIDNDTKKSSTDLALSGYVKASVNVDISEILEQLPLPLQNRLAEVTNHYLEQIDSLREREHSLRNRNLTVSEELVQAISQKELMEESYSEIENLKEKCNNFEKRYLGALEIAGAKSEELEELKQDYVDAKLIYQEQLNFLLNKIEQLEKK